MSNLIFLDLNVINLYGYEPVKSDKVIDSFVRSIEEGDEFPAVPVRKIDDNTYELVDSIRNERDWPDGGHRRAVAHYIANQPLKCFITEKENCWYDCNFNIKDTILEEDNRVDLQDSYDYIKSKDPNYL